MALDKNGKIFLWREATSIEIFSMLLFIWFGFILSLPNGMFASSLSYQALTQLMPEWAWSLVCFHNAILQFVGMTYLDKNHKHRGVGLLVASAFWVSFGTLMFLGNNASTDTGSFIILGLLCSVSYVKYQGVS